jgi:hypothetical protein
VILNLQAAAQQLLRVQGMFENGTGSLPQPVQHVRLSAQMELWGFLTNERPTVKVVEEGEDAAHYLDRILTELTRIAADDKYAAVEVPS